MKFQFGPRYPSRSTQVSRALKSILKAKFYMDAFPLRTGLTNATEELSRFLFETESHGVRLLLPPSLYFYWSSRVPLYIAIQVHWSLWWEILLFKNCQCSYRYVLLQRISNVSRLEVIPRAWFPHFAREIKFCQYSVDGPPLVPLASLGSWRRWRLCNREIIYAFLDFEMKLCQ